MPVAGEQYLVVAWERVYFFEALNQEKKQMDISKRHFTFETATPNRGYWPS